jgi:hypothetical protein
VSLVVALLAILFGDSVVSHRRRPLPAPPSLQRVLAILACLVAVAFGANRTDEELTAENARMTGDITVAKADLHKINMEVAGLKAQLETEIPELEAGIKEDQEPSGSERQPRGAV